MAEWEAFDNGHLPKLERTFRTKHGDEIGPLTYRVHRETPYVNPRLQYWQDGSWKDVGMLNAQWIIKNCTWRYSADAPQ